MTKISDLQVREIRFLAQQNSGRKGVFPALAKRYGVSRALIRQICNRSKRNEIPDNFYALGRLPVLFPAIGTSQRTAPRVNVLRGYFGNEPFGRSYSAPVASGVTILSGQLISLSNGSWVLGVPAGQEPFIAFADSTDTDVISSGLLLGLSCAGQYEIETPWFDNTVVYNESSFLVAATGGSTTANVSPGTAALGAITLGTSGANADVIGYASGGGRQDATAINSQSGFIGGSPASKIYLLRFRTQWFPHAQYST